MLLIKRPRQVQASSSPATPIRPSLRVASQVWRSPRDSRWFACMSVKTRLLYQKGFPSSRDPPDRRLRSAYPRVSSFDCRTRAARDEAVWLWWGKKETERRRARKNVTGRSCGAVVQHGVCFPFVQHCPDRNCAISAGCCRSSGHLLSDRHAKRKQIHAAPLALETQLHERGARHTTDLIRWASFGRILAVMSIVEPALIGQSSQISRTTTSWRGRPFGA